MASNIKIRAPHVGLYMKNNLTSFEELHDNMLRDGSEDVAMSIRNTLDLYYLGQNDFNSVMSVLYESFKIGYDNDKLVYEGINYGQIATFNEIKDITEEDVEAFIKEKEAEVERLQFSTNNSNEKKSGAGCLNIFLIPIIGLGVLSFYLFF